MAYPQPTEVSPWYLRNITQALELDEASGNVFVRTNAALIGNVTVGNVAIGALGNVDISSNTLPVTVSSGNVTVYQGTNPWIVTGNTVVSGTVAVSSIASNVTIQDGGGSITVDGNVGITGTANVVLADDANVVISAFSGATADAFGRLRVSNPFTLFDSQNQYHDTEQFASATTGAGNVAYNANSSTFLLSVSSNGDSVKRETTKTFVYQPGKSLLVLDTFCGNTPTAGLTQRVGYFDTNNGVFFEVSGTTLNMVIRSYSGGSIVEDRIPQNLWNGDRLNGLGGATNPSGISLNVALTQIFFADIEWLGVGSVRTGFVINGQYIICHTFQHANEPGNTNTYMGTAILPVRYEISSTGPAATLRQICSTVISEGGYTLSGSPGGVGHVLGTPVRLSNTPSVFTPLIAIRLKSTNPNAVVLPVDFTIVPEDQAIIKFQIYPRAVTSGGTWTAFTANSSVEYNLAPTALVSGTPSYSSFLISNNQSINTPQDEGFGFEEQLQRDPFTATMYEYVIMAATTGTNIDVYAAINWQECT